MLRMAVAGWRTGLERAHGQARAPAEGGEGKTDELARLQKYAKRAQINYIFGRAGARPPPRFPGGFDCWVLLGARLTKKRAS